MSYFFRVKNFISQRIRKQKEPPAIRFIAGDIVNQCNLRCPFCLVDYTNTGPLKLMTRETYDRCMELMPITAPGGLWLSCLHEPTLHPQFLDFIDATPQAYRNRISFTTNLALRLSEDTLERLANSGVHQIRVSFDSRRPEVFAELRKKAKYDVFDDNLRRLAKALKANNSPPAFHFITMVFKDNKQEVADLVRYGRELGANSHEIRYAYYVPSLARWGKVHLLSLAEWAEVEQDLKPLTSVNLHVCGHSGPVLTACEEEHGLANYVPPKNAFGGDDDALALAAPEPSAFGVRLPDEPLELRLRWDGLIQPCKAESFRANIKTISAPAEYFRALRLAACKKSEESRLLP
jgi:molybdenum cofactor biosynthesis enzyme MoaA